MSTLLEDLAARLDALPDSASTKERIAAMEAVCDEVEAVRERLIREHPELARTE
jgi:hypothetical protein